MILRKRKRYDIQGTPISYVEDVVKKEQLDPDDYLMVSQPDCIADVLKEGYYKSNAISFSEFENQLSTDILNALGLGSIINDPVEKYAKARHFHPQYSKIEVESYCNNRKDKVLSSLVTFEVDGFSENVSIPDAIGRKQLAGAEHLQLAPYVGEMRLFGAYTYKKIFNANRLVTNMDNDMFSGWAIPDGSSINKDRFPLAYEMFGPNLPIIDEYLLKLNPFFTNVTDGKNSNALVQASKIPVESHQHKIDNAKVIYKSSGKNEKKASFKYQLHTKVHFDDTFDWGLAAVDNLCENVFEYGYRPCGCTQQPISVSIKMKSTIDASNVQTSVRESDPELANNPTVPSKTKVLALVYIGKPFINEQQPTEVDDGNNSNVLPDSQYEEYTP